jgi:hypothetical protein
MERKGPRRPGKDASYEVGYGKPPKHTRFKPGQSGHPSGRPRGQRNFRTAVREALKEKITIREGDRTRTVTKMDGIIQVTFNKALKGDPKGLVAFLQLVRWAGLMDEEPERSSADSLGAEDEAILAEFFKRYGVTLSETSPVEQETSSIKSRKKQEDET